MGFVGNNKVHLIEYNKSRIDRQFLRIEINNAISSHVVVIMKNPSTTCNNSFLPIGTNTISKYRDKSKCHIDRTTGIVLRKLSAMYDEIFILNLYSLFDSQPSNVDMFYYGSGILPSNFSCNNLQIQNFLSTYKGDVICAWGQNNGIRQPEYDNQINRINSFFNMNHNLLEYDCSTCTFIRRTMTMYPPHGLVWK